MSTHSPNTAEKSVRFSLGGKKSNANMNINSSFYKEAVLEAFEDHVDKIKNSNLNLKRKLSINNNKEQKEHCFSAH